MKKVIITGGSGFIGSRFIRRWQKCFDILSPTHQELDITNKDAVVQYVKKNGADVILHTAAISNTGYCEEHPDESYLVNVTGVENLAKAVAGHNIKFVFFSSDQIYNGNHELGLLSEDIPSSPENHYGRHKLLAEERALNICSNTVALRATWMYDSERPGMKTHRNFVLNFQEAKENGTPLRFATREFRGITWIEDVVRNIPHTFDLPGGVYNFGAENHLNTYETALEYARLQNISPEDELVIPDPERFPQHIRNLSISMGKAHKASNGKINFMSTLEGLAAFLN